MKKKISSTGFTKESLNKLIRYENSHPKSTYFKIPVSKSVTESLNSRQSDKDELE